MQTNNDCDNTMTNAFAIAALYQFHSWPKPIQEAQQELKAWCREHQLFGSLLVGEEGINGTVAGELSNLRELRDHLANAYGFRHLEYKESWTDSRPFWRMKVKLKKEIVTLGKPEADPTKICGTYVAPQEWNELLRDPEAIIIDTRNDYEYEIGTFEGARNPNTRSFREFPDVIQSWNLPKDKPIVTFCTGGIRCEKATAYLKAEGFQNVYHLKGGILKYLEEIPESESLWKGGCFVFDHRVSVGHNLEPTDHTMCYGCRHPLSAEDRQHPLYEKSVSCHRCAPHMSDTDKARFRERQKQILLAEKRQELHIGRVVEPRNASARE